MRKSQTTAKMGGNQVKVTVRFESEVCEEGTRESRMEQMRLLRMLGDTAELHLCGYLAFQKMSMKHTGGVWVMELEAIGPE